MFTSVDIRGVSRGQCSLNNCECDSFVRSSCPDLSGISNTLLQCGWCCYCGHAPTSHSRLGTRYIVQEQPLTKESSFVADEDMKCEVHFEPEGGSEEAGSSPPAPKRSRIDLEAPSPEPDPWERVAQLEEENAALWKQLPGEETSAMQQEILKVLDRITALTDSQGKVLRKLLRCAASHHSQPAEEYADVSFLRLIPLSTHDSLEQFEQHLRVAKNRADLVAYFSGVHGTSLKDSVHQLLRRSMEDTLAQDFSLLGKKGKRPFYKLRLLRVIKETLLGIYSQATEARIHHAVASWLRHAPARHNKFGGLPSPCICARPELGTSSEHQELPAYMA